MASAAASTPQPMEQDQPPQGAAQPQDDDPAPVEPKTIKALTVLSLKRTYDMFSGEVGTHAPLLEEG